MYAAKVLTMLLLVSIGAAKRDKVCGTGIIPFSGFKVVRQYKLSLSKFKPFSQQFITLVHCNHGKADYEKWVKVDSITQIDWEKTFCMHKPQFGTVSPGVLEDTVRSLVKGNVTAAPTPTTIGNQKLKGYIRTKFDKLLEFITNNNGFFEYTGKNKHDHIKDIESATLEASMEWESRNLVCYKLARRKKYSKRDISFYIPSTFVGGLFECELSPERKTEVYKRFSMDDTIKSFSFECDPLLSRALLPLVADQSTNQWWDVKKNVFSPSAMQNIPYLTTPDYTNFRFGLTNTPELSEDMWAAKIRVNEDYDFTDFDTHIVSQAIQMASDLVFKLLKPIDWGNLLKEEVDFKVAGKPITENDVVIDTVKRFSSDQKLSLLLSISPSKYTKILETFQQTWDKLVSDI